MRGALAITAAVVFLARAAHADPLPPGSIGAFFGAGSGTGADAKRLGYGYLLGAHAAWQPMDTSQRINWAARWSVTFGTMMGAGAARINSDLLILKMDLMPGVRIRPGETPSRYVTLRAGGMVMRTDQIIPNKMTRSFFGPIASIGLDQYLGGFLLSVDLRYSMIGLGPSELGLVIGLAKTGP
ncbi:MAG: hypothetical protein ACKV2T_13405 [Kofleriaceae bacterium]